MQSKAIAAAVAAALAFPGAAAAQEKIELKVSHYVPPTHFWHVEMLTPWAAEMAKRTGGKVTVRLFAGNSPFGNVANQADQVAAGVTDIGFALNGVPRGRVPRTLLIELPMVATSSEVATRTVWSMRASHLAEDYKGFKLVGLQCSTGIGFFTREKKIEKLDDLKGLRLRAPSAQIQAVLQHLGAVPVTMGPGQIYEALDKRTLDGIAMVYDGLVGFRIESLVKHYYRADLMVICFHAVMNEKKYASLPADVKKVLDETTGDAWTEAFPKAWEKSELASGNIARAKGVVEVVPPAAVRAKWRAEFKPVIDQQIAATEKQGVSNARAIYDEMVKRAEGFAKK
jgi:TRAP-type C4-dicarboxylate transport system substrate-binding protein